MTTAEALTFADLSKQARPYPSYLLPNTGTALSLFAAGFHGWNDVVHFARQGLVTTCVDTDAERLEEMRAVYPDDWTFSVDDAWRFAAQAAVDGRRWDVVSVDPFFGDAAERAWDTLYLWTELARKMLTLTVRSNTVLNVPETWRYSYFPRSEQAAWLVMRRA